jgi:hypothetical protein
LYHHHQTDELISSSVFPGVGDMGQEAGFKKWKLPRLAIEVSGWVFGAFAEEHGLAHDEVSGLTMAVRIR